MKKKDVIYPIFGLLFASLLVVATVELFFRAVPDFLPREFSHIEYVTYDPVVGSKLKPNYEINLQIQDDITYNVKTKDLGFEGIGFRDEGVEDEVFGVTVGDSFTFGEGVNASDTWTEILERETGKDFINMGVSGHGTEHELRFLQEYGFGLEPKVIVLMFHDNDFYNNEGFINTEYQGIRNFLRENSITYEMAKFSLRRITDNSGHFSNDTVKIYKDENLDFAFFTSWWWKKTDSSSDKVKFGQEVTEKNFAEIKETADSMGAAFVVAIVPAKENIYSYLIEDEIDTSIYDLNYPTKTALEICDRVGVDCIDMNTVLSEKGATEQLYFKYDGHLNERGNEVVAEEILNYLQSKNLVS